MRSYLNTHEILQQRRIKAKETSTEGPKVMIVGGPASGKNSVAKYLCNYAARLGEQVTFVELDVGKGTITVPGNISAIKVERPIDIEEGFGLAIPLCYYFGQHKAIKNQELYIQQIQKISSTINKRNEVNAEARASGMIISTMGIAEDKEQQLLYRSIETFKPDIILVIAHPRLYHDLKEEFEKKFPGIQIEKLAKSEGVIASDTTQRKKLRKARIKQYFYGSGDMCPHSTIIPFHAFRLFKITLGPKAPSSALPIGAQSTVDPTKPREITPSAEILHAILGVSNATLVENIPLTNLAGFIYVQEINFERKTITALAPYPGPLPGKFLLLGNSKYLE